MDPNAGRDGRPDGEPPVWTSEALPDADPAADPTTAPYDSEFRWRRPVAGIPASAEPAPSGSAPVQPASADAPPGASVPQPASTDPAPSAYPAAYPAPYPPVSQPAYPPVYPPAYPAADPWATQRWTPEPRVYDEAAPAWSAPAVTPALTPPGGEPSPARRPSRLRSYGALFGVALLSAVLASVGTLGALGATGNLDHVSFSGAVATASQPPANAGLTEATPSTAAAASSNGAASQTGDIVAAVARVRPAVVTIEISGTGSGGGIGLPGQGGQGQTSGIGSGIIFDSNGWILTNRHVVSDGGTLTVVLSDGRRLPATTYGTDTLTDLAIVKVNATGLPVAPLGTSATLQVGQAAIAIGDPLGDYPGSVTSGIVSGLNRAVQVTSESLSDLIQTDAAINPGNSGGALVDITGHVIGVNTAASSSAQGIGFAIPIDLAKPLMQQALAGEKLARPWLGIRYVELDPAIASENKLSVTHGAWVTSDQSSGAAVQAGSPAEKAGLKENDIVTAIDGVTVDGSHPLIELMSSHAPGSSVTLTVRRGSQSLTLTLTLSTRPANAQ